MKFLVTGATGFIGSHVIKSLILQGHKVYACRRSDKSQTRISLPCEPIWITASLDKITPELFPKVDVLIHLAAHTVNVPYDTLQNCIYWNLISVMRLFDLALVSDVKRFIVAGSCFEYGKSGLEYPLIPSSHPCIQPIVTQRQKQLLLYVCRNGQMKFSLTRDATYFSRIWSR